MASCKLRLGCSDTSDCHGPCSIDIGNCSIFSLAPAYQLLDATATQSLSSECHGSFPAPTSACLLVCLSTHWFMARCPKHHYLTTMTDCSNGSRNCCMLNHAPVYWLLLVTLAQSPPSKAQAVVLQAVSQKPSPIHLEWHPYISPQQPC